MKSRESKDRLHLFLCVLILAAAFVVRLMNPSDPEESDAAQVFLTVGGYQSGEVGEAREVSVEDDETVQDEPVVILLRELSDVR